MNEIKIFSNELFGDIRVIEKENEAWFVGKDVAERLGYKDTSDAIKKHIDDEDFIVGELPTIKGNRSAKFINESGLYSLVLSSKLESAKQFKRWITKEVIPQIRKTGGYIPIDNNMSDSEIMAKALIVAQNTINKKNEIIETMQPKALFADAVSTSNTTILIGELAKILKQNGIETGQNKLFEYLRDNGYLIKRKGSDYNMPTQKSMELKLFEIKETTVTRPDGHITVNKTTKVTGKGQIYFINKFKGGK
ncbi:MAG: phage antirepressor [Sarcina sp.]